MVEGTTTLYNLAHILILWALRALKAVGSGFQGKRNLEKVKKRPKTPKFGFKTNILRGLQASH